MRWVCFKGGDSFCRVRQVLLIKGLVCLVGQHLRFGYIWGGNSGHSILCQWRFGISLARATTNNLTHQTTRREGFLSRCCCWDDNPTYMARVLARSHPYWYSAWAGVYLAHFRADSVCYCLISQTKPNIACFDKNWESGQEFFNGRFVPEVQCCGSSSRKAVVSNTFQIQNLVQTIWC